MTDKNTEDPRKQDPSSRKSWEEVLFGAFEKIASTPGRLRDPKESFSSAFDWMRGIREEVAERIQEEVSQRIGKIDWDQLASRVGDHLAKNYDLKVDAKIRWEPKPKAQEPHFERKGKPSSKEPPTSSPSSSSDSNDDGL